jgi:hypothetical protein
LQIGNPFWLKSKSIQQSQTGSLSQHAGEEAGLLRAVKSERQGKIWAKAEAFAAYAKQKLLSSCASLGIFPYFRLGNSLH